MATTDTVADRLWLSPLEVALALGVLLAVGGALAFLQEPAVHAALHDFRHATGIACH